MPFDRRLLHHGPQPDGTGQLLSLRALRSCWFELHRQGGCGSGELILSDDFEFRNQIEIGDWISCEAEAGVRWYLGRVEERTAEIPAQVRYRMEGMAVELNQIFPGGFAGQGDGAKPHRYAATDAFPADPDHAEETFDFAGSAEGVVRLLLQQYVTGKSHIQYDPALVEAPAFASPVTSIKVRGEESVRALMKDLALRAQAASWGVDAEGRFFFLRPRTTILATFREREDLTTLTETRDVEYLFNRLLLTGDYVYDHQEASEDIARKVYRWRGNYFQPESRVQFGDRRLKIWLPWIRTQNDALAFAQEFFRAYARPSSRYLMETTAQTALPLPWQGQIRLEAHDGAVLAVSRIETIRVLFDHAARFRMELGPEDPRSLWPEPPQDERWELPNQRVSIGGPVDDPPPIPSEGGGGGQASGPLSDDAPPPSSSIGVSSASSSASEQSSNDSSQESAVDSSSDGDWVSVPSSSADSSFRSESMSSSAKSSVDVSDDSSGGGASIPPSLTDWDSSTPTNAESGEESSSQISSAIESSSQGPTSTLDFDEHH